MGLSENINLSDKIIEAAPLREQVANILREMIIKGQFDPGEQLSERQLCAAFNISTTPIKEALRMLQTEGLVYTIPRKGTFISNALGDRISQSIMMRASLEGIAAGFAARDCTTNEIRNMEVILKQVEAMYKNGSTPDWKKIVALNDDFHGIIRDSCQNDYLINLIRSLQTIDHSLREISFELPDAVENHRQSLVEHRNILQAIKSHDDKAAENIMNAHVRDAAERVRRSRV